MKIPIIQIGNSKGIRLAKTILERYEITDKVELIFQEGYIILKPVRHAREGWEGAFQQMHERGDDLVGNTNWVAIDKIRAIEKGRKQNGRSGTFKHFFVGQKSNC